MGQKKNVYVRAHELVSELPPLIGRVKKRDRKLADQLQRAAQSVVLNIAEGRGNKDGNAELRFSTACGSAKEVRAALGIASTWGYLDAHTVAHLDEELDEICAITWVLSRKG